MSNNDHAALGIDTQKNPSPSPVFRCKHSAQMVNEVDERLLKMKAVADLLLCSRSGDLAEDTLNNIGWLLMDIVEETKAIVDEKVEVQP